MKRNRIVLGLVALLAASPAAAQVRVSVDVGVVAPPVYGHVVIGGPRYRVYAPRYNRYYHRPYYRPHSRRYYRPAVVVVVPRGHGYERHHRKRHYRHGDDDDDD